MDWKNRSAYVFIKTKKGKQQDVWKRIQSWDNIIGTWIVDGEWDVIAWLDAENWDVVHSCVKTIKDWDEVNHTSSHLIYNGFKNGCWWWEKPAGAWILLREDKLNQAFDIFKAWNWTISGASIPGDWDYMAWIGGQNWDEIFGHLMEIKKQNWETKTFIPIKSWWNENWKNKWW